MSNTNKAKAEQLGMPWGTAAYNNGCRCDKCKEAHRDRQRKYRASVVEW